MDNWKIIDYENFVNDYLMIDNDTVRRISREAKSENLYEETKLKKNAHKKERVVYAINKNSVIYLCQNNLKNKFFTNVFFSSCAYGFIKERSYFDYLNYHTIIGEETYFLRLDIKDFFNSISVEDFKECIEYYIDKNCSKNDKDKIIDLLIQITTHDEKFVQGAVTSPDISNLVFRSLDIRISNYCNKLGVKYSRYADDMLFSSSDKYIHSKRFIAMIKSIIAVKGFELNYEKILKQTGKLVINGYVITETINPSRKKFKNINNVLYLISKNPSIAKTLWGDPNYIVLNYICGYRCHLIQLSRYCDKRHKNMINKTINRIENVVEKYF